MPQEIEANSDEQHENVTEESISPSENDNSLPAADPVSVADLHEPRPLESTVVPDHDASILALAPDALPAHLNTIAASSLRPHPKNAEIMRDGTPEENAELDESIGTDRVKKPLVVTDETCASGYGFVVVGCRRLASATRLGIDVPVSWVSGLSAREEENVIAQDNLLDLFARKLSQGDKARTENFFWEREERGSGYRSDLQATGGTLGDITKGCNARKAVAAIVHQNENQVRNRHAVFYYAVSPVELKEAVNAGTITLSKGYELITGTISASNVPAQWATTAPSVDGVEPTEPPEVVQACGDIAAKVVKLLGGKPPKKKSEPLVPKILNSATLTLSEGRQRVPLGRHSLLAVPKGDTIELRETIRGVEPVLGGPHEDRPLTYVSSLESVQDLLNELPHEFTEGMVLNERAVTDPRLFFEAEIAFPGYPDLCPGKVRLTGWRRQGDWWEDESTSRGPRTAPDNPAIHIEGESSQKENLVYFAASHPYSTTRALKAFLQEVIFYELGPSYGVHTVGNTWVDRNGIELEVSRHRAPTPWDPRTPQSIPCRVKVAEYQEIERLPMYEPTPSDLEFHGCSADADALKASGQFPRFFRLPQGNIGYPVIEGWNSLDALAGLPVHHAAILARAMGFAIRPPNFFDSGPRPELANKWFLLTYAYSIDSFNRILLIDVGWIDEHGMCNGVMSIWIEGGNSYGMLHSISDIGRPHNKGLPAHILIDRRFFNVRPDSGDSCITDRGNESTALEPVHEEAAEELVSAPSYQEPEPPRLPTIAVGSLNFASTDPPSMAAIQYLSDNASGTSDFKQLEPPVGAHPIDVLPIVEGVSIYQVLTNDGTNELSSALDSLGYHRVPEGDKPPSYADLILVYGDEAHNTHVAVGIANMKQDIGALVSYVPEDGGLGVLICHSEGAPQTIWARKAQRSGRKHSPGVQMSKGAKTNVPEAVEHPPDGRMT